MFSSETLQADWLVPQRVLCTTMRGNLTADTLLAYDEVFTAQLQMLTQPVYLLMLGKDLTSYPPLSVMMSVRSARQPALRWYCIVGGNPKPVVRFMMGAVASVGRITLKTFLTREMACAYLVHQDTTLPPLKEWVITETVKE